MKPVYAALLAFLFIALTGCDPDKVKDEHIEIPKYIWNLDFKPKFTVPIEDTTMLYNVYVNVRHTTYYPFRNLWVLITTQFPDSTKIEKRVSLELANEEGRWYGDCLGDICDLKLMIQQNAFFTQPGNYTFQFEQIMRTDNLPLVMSIGLRVEKAGKRSENSAAPQSSAAN